MLRVSTLDQQRTEAREIERDRHEHTSTHTQMHTHTCLITVSVPLHNGAIVWHIRWLVSICITRKCGYTILCFAQSGHDVRIGSSTIQQARFCQLSDRIAACSLKTCAPPSPFHFMRSRSFRSSLHSMSWTSSWSVFVFFERRTRNVFGESSAAQPADTVSPLPPISSCGNTRFGITHTNKLEVFVPTFDH